MRLRAFGRYIPVAMALAAFSTATSAQDSAWGYFGGEGKTPLQAGVAGTDGTQLIIKCDKPGSASTYAMIVASEVLAPASTNRYENRPVRMRFDDGTTVEDNWRFFDKYASAVDDPSQKVMTRLVKKLSGASKFNILFERFRQAPLQATFNVAGAKDALDRVYASCKDKNPAAAG